MAVLTNTMLQGSSAATDDTPYVIEKSLRFAEEDSTRLDYEASNVKACFFLSFWVKRCEISDRDDIFVCNDNQGFFFYFDTNGQIKINDNYSNLFNSVGYYNDQNGWYHVFFEHDKDNLSKLYVNGKLDSTSTASGIALANDSWHVGWDGNNGYFSRLLADVCVLELPDTHVCAGPADAGTGEFNSTGVWVPKNLKTLDFTVGENSFWFKWDDSTTMRDDHLWINYGKSKELEGCTIQPICKTTDAFGHWAQHPVAYNTDSNASALRLAIPGNGLVDKSHTIKGSGSAVTVTANGSIANSSDASRFYDRSIRVDGSDDELTISSPPFTISDRSTTYTIEGWFYADESILSDNTYRSLFRAGSFNSGLYRSGAPNNNGNKIYFESDGNWVGFGMLSTNPIVAHRWYHIAMVRDGNAQRMYMDGVLQNSTTSTYTTDAETSWQFASASSSRWKGYMSDWKVYDTALYSSNFTVPERHHWPTKNGFVAGNIGKGWAYGSTSNTGWLSNKHPDKIFDGLTGTSAQTSSTAATMYVEFPKPITVESKLRLQYYGDTSNAPSAYFKINNGSSISRTQSGTGVWQDMGFTGELRSIEQYVTAGVSNQLYSIEVDDEILTDFTSNPHTDIRDIDVFVDTPTNSVPGGEDDTRTHTAFTKRGNYATLQPQRSNWTVTQGNLRAVSTSGYGHIHSNFGLPHYGKWYAEATANASGDALGVGLFRDTHRNTYMCNSSDTTRNVGYGYRIGGQKTTTNRSVTNNWGATWSSGDVIGLAFDADNGTIAFYKNGVSQGIAYSSIPVEVGKFWFFGQNNDSNTNNSDMTWNFGQKPWAYPCPVGYRACCTENLNDTFTGADVNNCRKFFDTKLYTGNGSEKAVTGFDFSPGLVWIKCRNAAYSHHWFDTARGGSKALTPDTNATEYSNAEYIKSFDSGGFTVGDEIGVNDNNKNYVAYGWNVGAAAASAASDGSITPDVQWKNATSGISISLFDTGSNGVKTIGHGLGAPVDFFIARGRDSTVNALTYDREATGVSNFFKLNLSNSRGSSSEIWSANDPSNTILGFNVPNSNPANVDTVIWAWAEIHGFSKMGIYRGNGSTSGPFVFTGFRPAMLIIKNSNSGGDWQMYDEARHDHNPYDTFLELNDTQAESDDGYSDIRMCANGFQVIDDGNDINLSGDDHHYIAFAAHPFKTSRAG